MKKILLFAITLVLATNSFSQITLEHTYEGFDNLRLIKLEVDGYKYVLCGKVSKQEYSYTRYDSTIYLYNLDHSIFKQITLPSYQTNPILISQNLFNLDSKIELLFSRGPVTGFSGTINYSTTIVLDEDGKKIFEDTSGYLPNTFGSVNEILSLDNDISKLIVNTSSGTKMILVRKNNQSNSPNGIIDCKTKVYSLPGRLSLTAIDKNEHKNSLSPFPNPSNNIITIPYQINSNAIASITITDMLGKVVKTYKVDNTFNSLLVNLDDFKSGTYVYTIQKENDLISQGKFIVSK